MLAALGVSVKIDPTPVEVANPIRCDEDTVHCTYDSDAATRFFHTLRIANTLLKRFSTNFYGKISPVRAYAAPTPDGFQNTVLKGKGGFNPKMGEFLLDYGEARDSDDPADAVPEFLQESYSAAADLANWGRSSLDRQDEVACVMRLKRSHTAQKPAR
jgi:Family of unknown function (DUF5996)